MSVATTARDREIALLFFVKRPMGDQWTWVDTGEDASENLVHGEVEDLAAILAEYRKELLGDAE